MGALTDLVVAPKDAAGAVLVADYAERTKQGWPTHESKFFFPDMLGAICAVLDGVDPDASLSPPRFVKHPFSPDEIEIKQATANIDRFDVTEGDDGITVLRFPGDFVTKLANLEGPAFETAAAVWRESFNKQEDFRGPLTKESSEEALATLSGLARRAVERDHAVFVWVCP